MGDTGVFVVLMVISAVTVGLIALASYLVSLARLRRWVAAQGYTLVRYETMPAYVYDKSPRWVSVFVVVATKDGREWGAVVKLNNFFFVPYAAPTGKFEPRG
jgi:hypothetical protein